MVSRAMTAVLVVAAGLLVIVLPRPDPVESIPDNTLVAPLATATGIWYCGGGNLAADPVFSSVLVDRGNATVTLLREGEIVDAATVQTGAGLAQFNAGDVLPFYAGAAIVEVSASPSAVGQVFVGDGLVAGSSCEAAAKESYLVGGSSGPDLALAVRLFNPLLESGVADLSVSTEFGLEPLLDFDRVVVAPRSFIDVPLDRILGERTSISVRVTVAEGVVIADFVSNLPQGAAVWNSTGLAQRWEFPLSVAGPGSTVAIWNPGPEPAVAIVSSFDAGGLVETTELSVGSRREGRLALNTTGGAVVVESESALAAALVYEGSRGYAGTTGLSQAASGWLVPVVGSHGGGRARIGLFNGGTVDASVLVRPRDSDRATQVVVPSGTAVELEAPGSGLEVSSNTPIAVGWRIDEAFETALGQGVPIR